MIVCNLCFKEVSNPWRIYDAHGKVVHGCVSEAHTGHLVPISESSRWHNRKIAKALRRQLAKTQKVFTEVRS